MPDLNSFGVACKKDCMVSCNISGPDSMDADFLTSGGDAFSAVDIFLASQDFADHVGCPKCGPAWSIFFLVMVSFYNLDIVVCKILCSFLYYLEKDVNAYGIIGGDYCTYLIFPDSFVNYCSLFRESGL